ncbi:MAG TPA: ribonuclease III [Opitutaceae bacterium]|nr:ribonuclease III [Opitutaceae bacterium]
MEFTHPSLERLQQRIGYTFRDPMLLLCALTHTSYLQDHPATGEGNQRLEYLGDSVLQLILSAALFELYPDQREGALSKRRATLTNGRFLSLIARDLGVDASLRLGPSEEQTGGRQRASILEDALEAIVGAIFLDSDFSTVRAVVLNWYGPLAERLAILLGEDNPKGALQELVQPQHGNRALRYEVTRTAGAPHEREYEVNVYLLDRLLGSGCGNSKKLAEESAARTALAAVKAGASADLLP